MVTAMDVANFFIDVFKNSDEPMTMLRTMRMTYNAQGCCLARMNEPLFEEEVQAWKQGPVILSVYRKLLPFKNNRIKKTIGDHSKNVFTEEQMQLMIDVAVKYGKYTTGTLTGWCNSPNGPWGKTYIENRRNIKISKELMYDHFSENEPLKGFDMEFVIKRMKPLGRSDPEGNTILPEDLDDNGI